MLLSTNVRRAVRASGSASGRGARKANRFAKSETTARKSVRVVIGEEWSIIGKEKGGLGSASEMRVKCV